MDDMSEKVSGVEMGTSASSRAHYTMLCASRDPFRVARFESVIFLNDFDERHTTPATTTTVCPSEVCLRGRRHYPRRVLPSSGPELLYSRYLVQFLSIRLVNKRTRVKLSPEPLDLTPIPNKGQLFVVASTLGWFVAIIRSNTGLGMFIISRSWPFSTPPFKLLFPRPFPTSGHTSLLRIQTLTMPFNRSERSPSPMSPQITFFLPSTTQGSLSALHMAQSLCLKLPPYAHQVIMKSPH